MTQDEKNPDIQRSHDYPSYLTIFGVSLNVDEAESIIDRIRELAAEIIAERDQELVAVVRAAIDQSRAVSWSVTSSDIIAAIRADGYSIVKDGASS